MKQMVSSDMEWTNFLFFHRKWRNQSCVVCLKKANDCVSCKVVRRGTFALLHLEQKLCSTCTLDSDETSLTLLFKAITDKISKVNLSFRVLSGLVTMCCCYADDVTVFWKNDRSLNPGEG